MLLTARRLRYFDLRWAISILCYSWQVIWHQTQSDPHTCAKVEPSWPVLSLKFCDFTKQLSYIKVHVIAIPKIYYTFCAYGSFDNHGLPPLGKCREHIHVCSWILSLIQRIFPPKSSLFRNSRKCCLGSQWWKENERKKWMNRNKTIWIENLGSVSWQSSQGLNSLARND